MIWTGLKHKNIAPNRWTTRISSVFSAVKQIHCIRSDHVSSPFLKDADQLGASLPWLSEAIGNSDDDSDDEWLTIVELIESVFYSFLFCIKWNTRESLWLNESIGTSVWHKTVSLCLITIIYSQREEEFCYLTRKLTFL